MKKFNILARWFLFNGLLMGLAYIAIFEHYLPAKHLVIFVVWLFAILSLAYLSTKACNEIFEKESATFTYLPRWVDITYDIIFIVILLYPGWYATAGAYTFFTIMQQSAWSMYKERQKEVANE